MDRELVERAQHGDREAYETIVRDTAPRLFAICQRIVHDHDVAEDATQRALVEMWRDLPGLRDPDRFDAWSYRLAVRSSYAEARQRRRLRGSVRLLPSDAADGPDEIGAIAQRDALDEAFGLLSLEQRAVIVLRYLVGLSLEETALVVGAPVGTVASRLHYGLRRMREALGADDESVAMTKGLPA